MLLQTLVALAAVCGLAYVIFRVVLPRLQIGQTGNSMIRVVERAPLDQKRTLFVVEVAGKWLLVGAGENGVQLVSELNEQSAEAAAAGIEAARAAQLKRIEDVRSGFAEKLASVMKRKELKENADEQLQKKPEPSWSNEK